MEDPMSRRHSEHPQAFDILLPSAQVEGLQGLLMARGRSSPKANAVPTSILWGPDWGGIKPRRAATGGRSFCQARSMDTEGIRGSGRVWVHYQDYDRYSMACLPDLPLSWPSSHRFHPLSSPALGSVALTWHCRRCCVASVLLRPPEGVEGTTQLGLLPAPVDRW